MRLIGLVLLLAGLPIFSFGQMLSPEVVATSGDYYSSPYLTLSVTIGEPVSETVSNDEHTLNQGFQQGDYTVNQVEETGNSPGNIRVFPNPASDFLNIVIESPLEEAITMVLAD
ncbi:MAG: hypothetical protein KKD31_12260, partial [Bacteroidetes bacterium]|nr:hypothetical protein [Bacteroidota bacterium]